MPTQQQQGRIPTTCTRHHHLHRGQVVGHYLSSSSRARAHRNLSLILLLPRPNNMNVNASVNAPMRTRIRSSMPPMAADTTSPLSMAHRRRRLVIMPALCRALHLWVISRLPWGPDIQLVGLAGMVSATWRNQ